MMRRIGFVRLAVVAFLALTISATAEVKSKTVEYEVDGVTMKGYMAWDDSSPEKRPGVIVIHEWWGLGDHPKRSAEKMAAMGYVGFALDMFGDGRYSDDPKDASKWSSMIKSDPALLKKRFEVALETMKSWAVVDPTRTAAIGYCFGGTVVLEAARMGLDLDGVVSFHGGLSSAVTPDLRKEIEAAILVAHGGNDSHVPDEELLAFLNEMRKADGDWQVSIYGGAVHSFTNPGADERGMPSVGYHEKAADRSWREMARFLEEIFNKSDGSPRDS